MRKSKSRKNRKRISQNKRLIWSLISLRNKKSSQRLSSCKKKKNQRLSSLKSPSVSKMSWSRKQKSLNHLHPNKNLCNFWPKLSTLSSWRSFPASEMIHHSPHMSWLIRSQTTAEFKSSTSWTSQIIRTTLWFWSLQIPSKKKCKFTMRSLFLRQMITKIVSWSTMKLSIRTATSGFSNRS